LHECGGVLEGEGFALFDDAAKLVLDRHNPLSVTKSGVLSAVSGRKSRD
jgi:hypothetical protein